MSTTHTQNIGKKIKTARKQAGLSQKDLAKHLKISDKTVSSYEVGRALPSFKAIQEIGKIVHKPINYFDENFDSQDLDLQIKIKIIEKELLEIKKLLKDKK